MVSLGNVLFNGLAYGMLLFVISVGLSVTMGLMGFANLAHGAFAMLGGYVATTLMNKAGVPFLLTLPVAFVAVAAVSFVLERVLYRRLYRAGELDQVLLTIGLVFMAVAGATYVWGPGQQPVRMPDYLTGQWTVAGIDIGVYRLFLILVGIAVTAALVLGIERTRFGAMIRAAVDNPRMAQGCGINVNRVFSLTFMAGSGLAGLGGAVGINLIGLDPGFPVKFMVYFLIVVAVGGLGSIKGSLIAALLLGVFDVGGKYYVPEAGAFIIYAVMVSLLLWRPAGLFGRR
ncbi:branched-chain amino acid ABC transporter permease [Azospirillum thermophilum]|uniref:Branched-chain amino acid ABC transporter permease n=1 Tax=Azospirillum thermophilum TaxID=2202148 RepID=A0A2S2D022_9PROT|nr:branched-chain amino acid ABC transporter permease [Azospirillum thermophilum]AWK89817.1 branched-chain amino acid ABC transporter permease [Azospirillum thermophilum]